MQTYYLFFFFFQAEDGIRDVAVTGVQTCALPISQGFESFRIDHVYREKNAEADALANEALDETARTNAPSPSKPKAPATSESRKVRARYAHGALQLREPLDLPEGTEVEILLKPIARR